MSAHYFSQAEREDQLRTLAEALARFIAELESSGKFSEEVATYRQALHETQRLLADGFNQNDLGVLSRSVPRLFWLHKEWSPPLEEIQGKTGTSLVEPAWFRRLEPFEAHVAVAAERLRVIGEY